MRKHFYAALAVTLCFALNASAQTLFTIDKEPVSVSQFLTAYKKNNAAAGKDVQGMKAYLDLYIASRLKIKEAKTRGIDTMPQLISDLQGLRRQILPSYLNDEAAINILVDEAFTRSQKDIHLAHIFIAAMGRDTMAAAQKAREAYGKLSGGEAFSDVAKQYSNDPSVMLNGGDAGFITVFGLPYHLENLIYKTAAGKASAVYRSKGGYHIFKNLGERKAVGRMKGAQILIALAPGATDNAKTAARRVADSIYKRLQAGDDFAKLATQFSNDVISAASNGVMPEFGVGDYEPLFENTIYGLAKDGAISKPFETAHGWHIVKRLARVPVATALTEKVKEALRVKVEQSDRINTTKDALAKRVILEAHLSEPTFNPDALWLYTDSLVNNKNPLPFTNSSNKDYLIQLGRKKVVLFDWIAYAQANRLAGNGSTSKQYGEQFWNSFIPHVALEYYKENLEDFNPLFRAQVEEFKDGNLFFEIMQQQVWGPAQTDTAALVNWYAAHRSNYMWKKSVDAVIFYASDAASANLLKKDLIKTPAGWKDHVAGLSEKIVADSNRFEIVSIPNP
ncbi:MAG TPA: peptidylprolyl isomerase, partial [Flavisolibacter sp.]|nr:peptidylprolyl isomerase [Flavisolibacter sp.]